MMKKTAVLVMVLMLTVLASAAMAGDKGGAMVGRLFLFQKCDSTLADVEGYDSMGCPLVEGPWPIMTENRRWGQMKYNLLGPEFRFSFQGKNLVPDMDYTLLYYPDPWPGENLVCLGSQKANDKGNLQIHGEHQFLVGDVPMGLPLPDDGNYKPIADSISGAVGAKIWLVSSADVQCGTEGEGESAVPPQMLAWNPASYLFEGNLIIYQYTAPVVVVDDAEDDADDDTDVDEQKPEVTETVVVTPENPGNNGNGNAYAKGKDK